MKNFVAAWDFIRWWKFLCGVNDMPENVQDTKKILELLNSGMTQAEVARSFGISKQAVNQRMKRFKTKTTVAAVTPAHVESVVQDKLNTIEQLKKTNVYANELLDACMAWTRGDETAIQVLESAARKIKVGGGGEDAVKWVTEYKFKDPREIALKAMAEIRNQLKLQFDIFTTIYSMRAAEEFQAAVLDTIGELHPDVATEIVRRLHARQSVRQVIEQPGQENRV